MSRSRFVVFAASVGGALLMACLTGIPTWEQVASVCALMVLGYLAACPVPEPELPWTWGDDGPCRHCLLCGARAQVWVGWAAFCEEHRAEADALAPFDQDEVA